MTRKSKEDVKQKILDTAETLFAQQGFDATGIDQIAKTAGITKSLIYYYFKSKDEILNFLFNDFIKNTLEFKNRVIDAWMTAHSASVDKIIREHSLPFMMTHKNVIKIAFAESLKEVAEIPHLNIFKYFDQNFSASYAIAQKIGFESERNQRQLLSSFFLFFAPLFSFVIFSDEWCDYYNIDLQTASNLFADSVGKLYSSLVREEIQNVNLDEMLRNGKKHRH